MFFSVESVRLQTDNGYADTLEFSKSTQCRGGGMDPHLRRRVRIILTVLAVLSDGVSKT